MYDLKTKILIVDDSFIMRKAAIRACRALGFTNFVEAGDGLTAWNLLEAAGSNIGLIISDWQMLNGTGMDLLQRVRAEERFKLTPFVIVTSETNPSLISEAIKAGVDNYVAKPIDPSTFERKLKDCYVKTSRRLAPIVRASAEAAGKPFTA